MSPLLWCLVVYKLIASSTGVEFILKDMWTTCLLAVGKFPNTISRLIQWALHTAEMWCDELRLSVNPNKTGLVAFTRRKLTGFPALCTKIVLKITTQRTYQTLFHPCSI